MPVSAALRQPASRHAVLAVFDLDGTLTRGDTLFPFLRYVAGTRGFLLRLPRALPWLVGLALGVVSRGRAKEGVLRAFLRGMTREELALRAAAFSRERLPSMLRPEAAQRLAWHQSRGHRCALVSASLLEYVEPWARSVGFDDVLATRLHYDPAGRVTGDLDGQNCRGEEKGRRLAEHYGDLGKLTTYGYGDSRADRHFLSLCTQAHYRPFRGATGGAARNHPLDLLRLLRPHQWLKNAFVFVGLVFGHAWAVPELVRAAVLAAIAFSLTASAIYIINDIADQERDRQHPKKRHRPLAAGQVTLPAALVLAAVLGLAGGASALAAGNTVLLVMAAYAAINVAYSFRLKSVVILDVFVIAAGFILRILAGTLGIGIPPSQWLLVCSLFLTLFLGFTKRRAELLSATSDFITQRRALLHYSPALLDKLIGICACGAIMSYSLYTMSPETARLHGTHDLIYTIPFVVYGMFRYLYLLHARHVGTDTSRELFLDLHLVATVAAWLAATVWLIS